MTKRWVGGTGATPHFAGRGDGRATPPTHHRDGDVMEVIYSWPEPYALDRCPRCGGPLTPPDPSLSRRCSPCALTVEPAQFTLEIGDTE